jgi:uncharacterized protein
MWGALSVKEKVYWARKNMGQFMAIAAKLIPQDYAEALKWYSLAADEGNAEARFRLGAMYVGGYGVP